VTSQADERTREYLIEQMKVSPGLLMSAVRVLHVRDEALSQAIRRLERAHEEWQYALAEVTDIATRIGAIGPLMETLKIQAGAESRPGPLAQDKETQPEREE
jgi:hypothetical protein